MGALAGGGFEPLRVAYITVYGGAAVACALATARGMGIDGDEIRRGIVGLAALSGLWAGAHVGRLLAPSAVSKAILYQAGLLFGFATVFAWLYFCSAYTGREFHRTAVYRWLALGLYGGVAVVKLTNGIHGRYFSTTTATEPFAHLAIEFGAVHWVVTGLAYALTAVGFYMLFEFFGRISYDATSLGLLAGLAGLPVALDLFGIFTNGLIITANYEPLGVAVFVVGVLYTVESTFLAVPRIGRHQFADVFDEPVLFFDGEGRLVDHNDAAAAFAGAPTIGDPAEEVLPAVGDLTAADDTVVTVDERSYLVGVTPLTAGDTLLGRVVVLTDVTEVERQRRELRRQNEQLDGFAAAVAHELRNSLGVMTGQVELIGESIVGTDAADSRERLEKLTETTDRIETVVADLTTLARLSKTVTDPQPMDFETAFEDAWKQAGPASEEVTLSVAGSGTIHGEPRRLAELLRNVAELATETGAETVTAELSGSELLVTTDGDAVDIDDPDRVFEYGTAVPDSRTGMSFANVQALARALNWTVTLAPDFQEGIRLWLVNATDDTG